MAEDTVPYSKEIKKPKLLKGMSGVNTFSLEIRMLQKLLLQLHLIIRHCVFYFMSALKKNSKVH